ncbi:prepilin-type N-terminal cleavage/methylation domain-containing protein [uncultured Gimesia sp.]|uniref:pilus assembly FimT family protein n=1 Tax=uncultured Gimesia sp. TaxID=1678688 RepID=UPI0030D73CDE|tara:strand:+ start:128928 stop:129578 length:651 start_codon:yes stop_codon:yes gene_type:complete
MQKFEPHDWQSSRRFSREKTPGIVLRAKQRHPTSRHGFTLIEMLIVMLLIAILVSVSLISTDSSRSMSLEATARMLVADLRLARNYAIKFNTKYKVLFDLDAQSYEVQHSGSGTLPVPKNNLAGSAEASDKYIKQLRSDSLNLPDQVLIRQINLKTSRSNVTDLEFGPMGGTGPTRNEDTILILSTERNGTTFIFPITVSWVTGQAWVEEIQTLKN